MTKLAMSLNVVFFLTLAYSGLGATAASASELPPNLVANPSLEDQVPAGGLPPGWGTFFSNPDGAYRTSIADGGRTGKKEMRYWKLNKNVRRVTLRDTRVYDVKLNDRSAANPASFYQVEIWMPRDGDLNLEFELGPPSTAMAP